MIETMVQMKLVEKQYKINRLMIEEIKDCY